MIHYIIFSLKICRVTVILDILRILNQITLLGTFYFKFLQKNVINLKSVFFGLSMSQNFMCL